MLKKVTSVLLAVSFFIVVVSGIIMMANKKLSFELRMTPFHEVFGVIMLITGIIHFILNFKSIACYLKTKSVNIIFCSTIGLAIILWVIALNIKLPEKNGDFHKYQNETESSVQLPD